jgi:hypothetical protein
VPAFASARRSYASATKEMTVREALNEAMSEEMEANSKVFVLGEEVYESCITVMEEYKLICCIGHNTTELTRSPRVCWINLEKRE